MSAEKPRERPILFNDQMVRAILEGRKTVTRRAVKGLQIPTEDKTTPHEGLRWSALGQRHLRYGFNVFGSTEEECAHELARCGVCPFGKPGDRLWVRETHAQVFEVDIPDGRPAGPIGTAGSPGRPDWKCRYVYRSDGEMPNVQWHHVGDSQPVRWTPSIHMPRRASRILLEITAVRVERLQDISEKQALAEGVELEGEGVCWAGAAGTASDSPVESFRLLWELINGAGSWNANPWVWVVEFKRVTP
ncbi:hypothetical protein [Pseudomonas aeruginosa]|uniref:hypothetical protein n=1 Tax=Pseudomonas aeruginosa TaxID=287 RepID=UPI00288028AA|nr:hypothetical protein [Pseudomonas aeruginosa]